MSNSTKQKNQFFENKIEAVKEIWLTTKEAAKYLKVSSNTLLNLTSNGKVPYYKLGSSNRYLMRDLRSLLFKTKKGGSDGNQI